MTDLFAIAMDRVARIEPDPPVDPTEQRARERPD